MKTFSRRIQILSMIPREPLVVTICEIETALEHTADHSNILRDVQLLIKTFKPDLERKRYLQCTDQKPDKSDRLFWRHDATPFALLSKNISKNHALFILLLKKHLYPIIPKSHETHSKTKQIFKEAESVIEQAHDDHLTNWLNKVEIIHPSQPLISPKVDERVSTLVTEAVLENKAITIEYQNSQGCFSQPTLKSIGIVLRNGSLYLIAEPQDGGDAKPYALHRILSAKILDRYFETPKTTLKEFIENGGMGFNFTFDPNDGQACRPIPFKAIFDGISANHLRESKLSANQRIRALTPSEYILGIGNQQYEVTAEVLLTEQLYWWLLSFGTRVKVLEPAALRLKMQETAQQMALIYKS